MYKDIEFNEEDKTKKGSKPSNDNLKVAKGKNMPTSIDISINTSLLNLHKVDLSVLCLISSYYLRTS